jgi:hypothetical protein
MSTGIDLRRPHPGERRPHDVAGLQLRHPLQRVGHEAVGLQHRPAEAGLLDGRLGLDVVAGHGVRQVAERHGAAGQERHALHAGPPHRQRA